MLIIFTICPAFPVCARAINYCATRSFSDCNIRGNIGVMKTENVKWITERCRPLRLWSPISTYLLAQVDLEFTVNCTELSFHQHHCHHIITETMYYIKCIINLFIVKDSYVYTTRIINSKSLSTQISSRNNKTNFWILVCS